MGYSLFHKLGKKPEKKAPAPSPPPPATTPPPAPTPRPPALAPPLPPMQKPPAPSPPSSPPPRVVARPLKGGGYMSAPAQPPYPLGRDVAYPRGPRPYTGGCCMPELIEWVSRYPGTSFEFTLSKTYSWNPMDDDYNYDDYGPPTRTIAPGPFRRMAPPLPPPPRRRLVPPLDYQYGPREPFMASRHHAHDYPYGPQYGHPEEFVDRHHAHEYPCGPPHLGYYGRY